MAASRLTVKLTEDPGEAEVTQLDDLVLGDEDVLRLDVSVDALHQENRSNTYNRGDKVETAPTPTPPRDVVALLKSLLFVASL